MYRRSKKRRNKKKSSCESAFSDFTVQDVANNPRPVASLKKKSFNTSTLTQFSRVEAARENPMLEDGDVEHWYDRDLSDFDDLEDFDQLEIPPAVEEKKNGSEGFKGGLVYPADLWYLLGDHIHPEDIGRFSALCRGALHVTCSVSFWRKLYFRYWNEEISLPPHLQPFSIKYSDDSLRAKVIGALYRMYPPFQQRNKSCQLDCAKSESDSLIGSTCHFLCNQGRTGSNYCHYVKFRKSPSPSEQNLRNALIGNTGLWGNPSEGEVMLRVTCPVSQHFSSEEIMGLQLASISTSVGRDMCYNKLKMEFVRTFDPRRRRDGKENRVLAVLEPVVCVAVLNWWHPLFHDSFLHQAQSVIPQRGRGPRGANASLWDSWYRFEVSNQQDN